MGILALAKENRYGPYRLNNACKRAALFDNYSYHSIESILKKDLDRLTPAPTQYALPLHHNVRNDYR